MPAPSKIIKGFGLTSKLEASYNAGGSLSTSTDGLLLEELATLKITPANTGERPMPAGAFGYQRNVAPSAFAADLSLKHAPKGAGAAYSASVVPSVHTLARSCALNGTVTVTGGSEKWDYTPIAPGDAVSSLVQGFYGRGQLYPLQGMLGDFTLTIPAGGIPILDYHAMGVAGYPTDVSLPVITYPALGIDPPKANNIAFQINSSPIAYVIRQIRIKWGRKPAPRLDANAAGPHAGFWGVTRTPTMEIDLETPLSSLQDLWSQTNVPQGSAPPQFAWQFTIGTNQYNRQILLGPAAQQFGLPDEKSDGEVSLTTVTYHLNPSNLGLSDEFTWRWN